MSVQKCKTKNKSLPKDVRVIPYYSVQFKIP